MSETPRNKGQRFLAELANEHGKLKEISGLVGIHPNQLRHYLNGTRKPLIEARNRLQAKLGIPFFSWDQAVTEQPAAGAA